MGRKISRRDLLKNAVVAAGVSKLAVAGTPAHTPAPASTEILPLTSTSDVFVPPRGESFMQFSFDFPEPSVAFAGHRFSFRLHTFENAYAPDRERMRVEERTDGLDVVCSGLVWAGGQERAPGTLTARLRRNGAFIECTVSAETDRPIKSVAAVVRDVPRGKISVGPRGFFDPKDDEVLLGYPFGAGALFTARGMDTPLAVIQAGDQDYFFVSALVDRVTANRFYFQPGATGYRVELIFEKEGWLKSNRLEGPTWRIGRTSGLDGAFRPHFEHVERAFAVPDWDRRDDVPAWFRRTALVLAVHGMHWTGYVFNDYAKTLEILKWAATQIDPERVLVFLPAWDGRYYWNYPIYEPDRRLGGEGGFRTLVREGQKLGFRVMPMFGTNTANRELAEFARVADATTSRIDGDAFNLNWVDWDNDRHFEGWSPYMNVGVESWRRHLAERISSVVDRFGVDAYFLDIVGGWQNNTKADMHEGTRLLITELRRKYPRVLACGEMHYDALMSFLPVYQVYPASGYPAAFDKYARSFQHVSRPAPGRGSSGVHEHGFSRFDPESPAEGSAAIPTITVVDDTFDKHRDVMAEVISRARRRGGIA
jgi:hypothetical protein